jgi:hypothetical protein
MAEPTSCCVEPGGYCARVDTLFNLPGVHVLTVAWREAQRPALRRALAEREEQRCRGRLSRLRGDRRSPRPQRTATARHPGVRRTGHVVVAAAPIPLPRTRLPGPVDSAKIIRSHPRGPS